MRLYLPSTHSLVAVLDDEHLNYAANIVNENDSLHIFTSFLNKVTTNEQPINREMVNKTVSLLCFKKHGKLSSEQLQVLSFS